MKYISEIHKTFQKIYKHHREPMLKFSQFYAKPIITGNSDNNWTMGTKTGQFHRKFV